MDPTAGSEQSSRSTGSGSLRRSDEDGSPALPPRESFVSIESFLDSVSNGAVIGTPEINSRRLRPVEPLDLLEEDAEESSAPAASPFPPEPEPEPEPEPGPVTIPAPPVPPPRPSLPQPQSREASLALAQPPTGSVLSSSDGSDDSGDQPEPGGAVFDVVQEVRRPAILPCGLALADRPRCSYASRERA